VAGTGAAPTGTLLQIVSTGLLAAAAANSNTVCDCYIYGGTSGGATVTFTAGASGSSCGQIVGRLL
jgi:hypothetical protein